jgi:8-oxo-dGTP pyrophosphatase MutT (NUDIX family)
MPADAQLLIPAAQAADTVASVTGAPLVPRDAATIMLVRDRDDTLEVLMLRRNDRSVWVAGAHLFPGGAVDEADSSAEVAARCAGLDDAGASRSLGIDRGGLSFFVAAVRECFEEAGILLASRHGESLSFDEGGRQARFGHHRRRLNAGETTLTAICEAEDLYLELGSVAYFSHWITPEGPPRRYDTRFFVATVPEGQEALHDDAEVVASTWIRPGEALDRHRQGELDLMFPTMKNLEAIGRFSSAPAVMEAASGAAVAAVLPRITLEGEVARIVLPGDDGYDTATGLPAGMPFPDAPRS